VSHLTHVCLEELAEYGVQSYDQVESLQEEFSELTKLEIRRDFRKVLEPDGPGFESRSPRIVQARVRLATNTLLQIPHRAGALCRYAHQNRMVTLLTQKEQVKPKAFTVTWEIYYLHHATSIISVSGTSLQSTQRR
jgi:hypothetical protein